MSQTHSQYYLVNHLGKSYRFHMILQNIDKGGEEELPILEIQDIPEKLDGLIRFEQSVELFNKSSS